MDKATATASESLKPSEIQVSASRQPHYSPTQRATYPATPSRLCRLVTYNPATEKMQFICRDRPLREVVTDAEVIHARRLDAGRAAKLEEKAKLKAEIQQDLARATFNKE